jgi:hypothetical protein
MADPVTQTAEQTAEQIAQEVSQGVQAIKQAAQQAAQQIGEAVSQAQQKFMQTTGAVGVAAREELGDIGGTEGLEGDLIKHARLMDANTKRTYDEFLGVSLEAVRRDRAYIDKVLSDAQTHTVRMQTLAEQAQQNALETGNMVGKQTLRHSDVAIDNQWNPVQQGSGDVLTARAVSIDDASLKAIGAMVAAAVAEAVTKKA